MQTMDFPGNNPDNAYMRQLDIENWHRKEQFFFFKDYDNPFFNVCTELDVGPLTKFIDSYDCTFSTALLFASLKAANETEPLRYRLEDDHVVVYDKVDAGHRILNDDESFSFCHFEYDPDFEAFCKHSHRVLQTHRTGGDGSLTAQRHANNLIHCSTLPWFKFTGFSHARNYDNGDSIPKFVFGKYYHEGSTLMFPFSIEVHHALMDGIHIARYLERFQELLTHPNETLVT